MSIHINTGTEEITISYVDKDDKTIGPFVLRPNQFAIFGTLPTSNLSFSQAGTGSSSATGIHELHTSALKALSKVDPAGNFLRVEIGPNNGLPDITATGEPPCCSPDGNSPVYFGSIRTHGGHLPCKVNRNVQPEPCHCTDKGLERRRESSESYTVLNFHKYLMELVPTSHGRIPEGRRPVIGGWSEGQTLYHVVAPVNGVRIPGRTSRREACVYTAGFDSKEYRFEANYEILCWKD